MDNEQINRLRNDIEPLQDNKPKEIEEMDTKIAKTTKRKNDESPDGSPDKKRTMQGRSRQSTAGKG